MIGIIKVGIVVESGIAEDLQLQLHSSHLSFVDCHATGWIGCWALGRGRWNRRRYWKQQPRIGLARDSPETSRKSHHPGKAV